MTGTHPTDEQPLIRIRPGSGRAVIDLGELWRYRELLWLLAVRDVKVRYKQTALGVAWAVLQPLFTMIVFSVFFGRLAKVPSDGLPYPIFSLVGLVPWQLFAYALSQSSNSLVSEQKLITKVYFPRLIVPLASVMSGLADFAVAFFLVVLAIIGYGLAGHPLSLGWPMLLLPLLVVQTVISALAVGLWLAALNVEYRDVRYTLPFITQLWLFATPIAYPSSLVPAAWRPLYGLNPMTGVVDGFRWALAGGPQPDLRMVAVSLATAVILLIAGVRYFQKQERRFADTI
jgi:lipopolysaccharide transport system permease protein